MSATLEKAWRQMDYCNTETNNGFQEVEAEAKFVNEQACFRTCWKRRDLMDVGDNGNSSRQAK